MDFWVACLEYWNRAVQYFDTAFIGLIGAGVGYFFTPRDKSLEAKEARNLFMIFLISGGIIAHFTAPALMHWFNFDDESAGTVAFFVGALGGSLLAATLKAINSMELDIWPFIKSIIRAKLGVKENTND